MKLSNVNWIERGRDLGTDVNTAYTFEPTGDTNAKSARFAHMDLATVDNKIITGGDVSNADIRKAMVHIFFGVDEMGNTIIRKHMGTPIHGILAHNVRILIPAIIDDSAASAATMALWGNTTTGEYIIGDATALTGTYTGTNVKIPDVKMIRIDRTAGPEKEVDCKTGTPVEQQALVSVFFI